MMRLDGGRNGKTTRMIACHVFGHRYRFSVQGRVMAWDCGRCGRPGGSKMYDTEEHALAYATAFDREDSADLGRRAPLLGMFPLRIAHAVRRRSRG
ncbi:DUF1660 family phage protein [Tomitella cavernea]|uniref:DUF1660 family phage protein n=2 Tax=Tomitella cavernea TaxID=1387982 RepID=A0ABP9CRT7_9ACTN